MLGQALVKRVMWLINDTTLREFEIPQLKRLGIAEIFTPKNFPHDERILSASVTHEFDETLSLSQTELDILNEQEWYKDASPKAWEIANRHFDTIFLSFFPQQLESVLKNFKGTIVLRVFGLANEETYSDLIHQFGGTSLQKRVMDAGVRFWFGMGYSELADAEESYIADRAVYLPAGLKSTHISNEWQGKDNHILFVCPHIRSSDYYNKVYKDFKQAFDGIPYLIAGSQPIKVPDPNVLGFLSSAAYDDIMQQSRVMFYHNQDPHHIHYHPFEAIRMGMPLVFMSGGMLDSLGGGNLPGRCKSTASARYKITQLMNGNKKLLRSIKKSQEILLHKMRPEFCAKFWASGIARIQAVRNEFMVERPNIQSKRKKIAIIIAKLYKGGTLRGAISLVQALYEGCQQCNDDAELIFAHIDDPDFHTREDFFEIEEIASLRPFKFELLSRNEAKDAMYSAGFKGWEPEEESYQVLNDGINYMMDCDHWIFVSDRVFTPILPIKAYTVMIYDYIQRYVNFFPEEDNRAVISFANSAEKVWMTTKFTYENAIQYAGISKKKLVQVPMLVPDFPIQRHELDDTTQFSYFLWTTNPALHKNHVNAFTALRIYYNELDGKLQCKVTGFDTNNFDAYQNIPHLKKTIDILKSSNKLERHVKLLGLLPDGEYRDLLSKSSFLWHPAKVDNGTFSVVEGACFGVPSLSSDYPSMHEINDQFSLNLVWQDANDPTDMAERLKYMEQEALSLRRKLPSPPQLIEQKISSHAEHYWRELLKCL